MCSWHTADSQEWLNEEKGGQWKKWTSGHIGCLQPALSSRSFVGIFLISLLTYFSPMNKNYFQSREHKDGRRKRTLVLTLVFWVWVFRETEAVWEALRLQVYLGAPLSPQTPAGTQGVSFFLQWVLIFMVLSLFILVTHVYHYSIMQGMWHRWSVWTAWSATWFEVTVQGGASSSFL